MPIGKCLFSQPWLTQRTCHIGLADCIWCWGQKGTASCSGRRRLEQDAVVRDRHTLYHALILWHTATQMNCRLYNLCLVYTVHMVREVDKGSPAELGSVKEGEMLLEVNGESTESLSHNQVVSKIRQSGPQVTLTTMPPLGQDFYNKVNIQSEHINTNTGMILQLRHFLKIISQK